MEKEYALEIFDRNGKFSQQIDVFKTFEEAHAEMLKEQKKISDKEETLSITEIIYNENGEEMMNATCAMQLNQHERG
jgi:hypothetical protein